MRTCTACGKSYDAPNGARFCMHCGAAVAETPLSDGERRQITVVFIDIVAFTDMASRLDAEEISDMIADYHAIVGRVTEELGGAVKEYLGDGAVLVFGFPLATEDAASRAIKATSLIIDTVKANGLSGTYVGLRAGIATGEVAVSPGAATDGNRLTGAVTSLAARLQSLAPIDGIVATDLTRKIAARNYLFTAREPVEIKGFSDKMIVHDVRDPATGATSLDRPIFGRDAELATLGSTDHPTIIWGAPGLGKSALAARYLAQQHAKDVITFQANSLGGTTSYQPVVAWILSRIGTPVTALSLVAEAFPELETEDIGFIGLLLGAPEALATFAQLMPALIQAKIENALVNMFVALANQRPLILLWEDLHWLDPSSQALLIRLKPALADTQARLLVTSRPDEALAASMEGFEALTLAPLQMEDARVLAHAVAGDHASQSDIADIALRGDGVPLYLEQLAQAFAAGETFDKVPPTLRDLLAARLDHAGPSKSVAQLASAMGRQFDIGLLCALTEMAETALSDAIKDLSSAGLLEALPDGGVRFTHALMADAAYDSMLRAQRRDVHSTIGDLMASGAHSANTPPETIAAHYARADRVGDAAGYWRMAAKMAAARGAFADAESHLTEALSLIQSKDDPAHTQSHVAILTQLGATRMQTQGFTGPDVISAYDAAEQILDGIDGPDSDAVGAMWGNFVYKVMIGDLDASQKTADRVFAIGQRGGNGVRQNEIEIAARTLKNCVAFYSGRFTEQLEHFEAIRESYDIATHAPLIPQYGMDFFGAAHMFDLHSRTFLGQLDKVDVMIAEADAHQETLGIPLMRPYALIWGGVPLIFIDRVDEALARFAPGIELADQQGDVFWSVTGRIWQAIALGQQGVTPEAAEQLKSSIDTCTLMGIGIGKCYFSAVLADMEAQLDRHADAQARIAASLASLDAGRDLWMGSEISRIGAGIAGISGDTARSRALFDTAKSMADAQFAPVLKQRVLRSAALWNYA